MERLSFAALFLLATSWLGACASEPASTGGMDVVPMAPVGSAGANAGGGAVGATGAGATGAGISGTGGADVVTAGASAAPWAGTGGSFAGTGGGAPVADPPLEPAPPTCPATSVLAPGDTNGTLEVGGATREYIVHVPPGYTGEVPVPLVLDWHPLLTSASFQRTGSGYAALADREGFIVAFPDGIDNAWNIGPCCTQSRDVDDLGFALALVEKLSEEACIDPKRVYAAGFSMGGGMSHFLACKAADVFAAVAPAAFDLIEEIVCQPARPITVISFRGTADFIVPYAGGASTPPTPYPLSPIHFLGAEGTFQKWAELDGCTGSPVATGGGCESYASCEAGVEVTLCTAQGGGHATGDAEVGWATLQRHTLP